MSKTILAIPSQLPGGMDSGMGMHFGHCDIYTIVELENGQVAGHDYPAGCQVIEHFHWAANFSGVPAAAARDGGLIRHEQDIGSCLVQGQFCIGNETSQFYILNCILFQPIYPGSRIGRVSAHPQELDLWIRFCQCDQ